MAAVSTEVRVRRNMIGSFYLQNGICFTHFLKNNNITVATPDDDDDDDKTGNQSAVRIIRGLATGVVHRGNEKRWLTREVIMGD